jgi:DNA repair protein RAD50
LEKECSQLGELENALLIDENKAEVLHRELRQIRAAKDELLRDSTEVQQDTDTAAQELENVEVVGRAEMDDIRSTRDALCLTSESLADVVMKLDSCNFEDIQIELEKIQETVLTATEMKQQLEPRMNTINSEIHSQDATRRNVQDNIDLRILKNTKKDMKIKKNEIQKKYGLTSDGDGGGGDGGERIQQLQRDIQRTEQQQSKYNEEVFKCRGRLEVLQQQALAIQNKLRTPIYKGIEDRHRRKSIQYETTELAVKDLDAYYAALDQALQSFHTLKIKEINKIIRELWQLTYKGQDIDMIELESGVDKEGASTTKTTRSYNYRVVMRKGDTPLDMRGRCSAGQRVLAAIVIRLALAETFCLNCGILALDEPTTNLDEANRSGLAHALARIIVARQRQQNFQLVCITHDEEFVKLMNSELVANSEFSMPEYYFKVSREEDDEGKGRYFSKIERCAWEEI